MGWKLVIAAGTTLVACWLLLIAALLAARRRGPPLAEVACILPDLLRLLRRLAADPTLPAGVRVRLWLLVAYLAAPIDVIPDFIPLIGYVDDAIIPAAVLRNVVRWAGLAPVR